MTQNPFSTTLPFEPETNTKNLIDSINIFDAPASENVVTDTQWIELLPQEQFVGSTRNFTFKKPRSEMPRYLNLSYIFLVVKSSIIKRNIRTGDTTHVTAKDNVAPTTFYPDSMFSRLELSLGNGQVVSNDFADRNLYTLMQRTLVFEEGPMNTYLATELARRAYGDSTVDNGFSNTAELFVGKEGEEPPIVTCVSLLTHQLSGVTGLIPNRLQLKVALKKAEDSKILTTGPKLGETDWSMDENHEYLVHIHKISLLVQEVTLSDYAFNLHEEMFNNKCAK